jgi:hypothetical protein
VPSASWKLSPTRHRSYSDDTISRRRNDKSPSQPRAARGSFYLNPCSTCRPRGNRNKGILASYPDGKPVVLIVVGVVP